MRDTAILNAQRAATFGRPTADGTPPAPPCTECGSPVLADGLVTCHRHVEAELGITYRQLDYWVRLGHLKPKQDARKSGVSRRWPRAELEIARRMARLTAAGLGVEQAARFARESWPSGEIAPGVRIMADAEAPFARGESGPGKSGGAERETT